MAGGGKVHAADLGHGHPAPGAAMLHRAKLSEAQLVDDAVVVAALAQTAKRAEARLVLLGSTKRGKALSSQLAGVLDADYAPEVSDVGVEGDRVWARRLVLSGQSVARIAFQGPVVATVTPKTFDPSTGASPSPTDERLELPAPRVRLVGRAAPATESVNLTESEVVVGVGRGFKKREDLRLAEELAKVLGGQIGCSRPIAADLKWLGEEHWIGLSGHEIKPKLYLAIGVSGQIQHMAGCRGAKVLAAVNTSEDAPIFAQADYGVVGDLYQVVPKLTELIRTKYK